MKKIVACFLLAVVICVTVCSGVLKTADKLVEDKLYHNPSSVDSRIRIIKIDDRTMNQLGDFSQWDRDIYGKLVETLCVSETIRPAVIGFDVLFSSTKDAETDQYFADVCDEYGNVVTCFSYVFEKNNTENNAFTVQEKVVPYEALQNATVQGFANALMDDNDSIIRSSFLYFDEEQGATTKSFSVAVYERYMEFCGETPSYPKNGSIMNFRYSGGISDYENVSLIDVINGTIPAEAFDDCIVLIGAYAAGMMDAYFVPVDRGQQMYGVEIQANVIQAIMDGKVLTTVPMWLDCLLATVIAVLLVLLCENRSVIKTLFICGVTIAAKMLFDFAMFNLGYSMNHLGIPISAILIMGYYLICHYYTIKKEKQRIKNAFSKYVAPQVVNEITEKGTYELKLGGENREIAVLFVDIRGFTPLSESLVAESVVDILNRYLELTTNCIFRHGGTLDKFIGDATMAVFNAPFDTEDYLYKAVLTAWDIVQGGRELEVQLMKRYGKQVGFGVGVHCGSAVVGNIGCNFRMDYTAIGDTVNTAARLESNAPKSSIYISRDVYEKLKDRILVEEVGTIPLKGKSKDVFVYSVIGINAATE